MPYKPECPAELHALYAWALSQAADDLLTTADHVLQDPHPIEPIDRALVEMGVGLVRALRARAAELSSR